MDIEQLNIYLINACYQGNLDGVKEALLNGADIHADDDNALRWACAKGHLEIVQYLLSSPELKEHANIHAKGDEALLEACEKGHLDVVRYLLTSSELKDHAYIHIYNDEALWKACKYGHLDVVQCLIQQGAHFEQFKPLEEWFSDHGDTFMLETIEGMKSEVLQPIMQEHGEYISSQYILAGIELPNNIKQYLPDIEHQEHDLYL